MTIEFYKYQGTGNDFVILDNRENKYNYLTAKQVKHICNRRFGIGADGLILLSYKKYFDFEMIYYNADGNEGSMCGNGGRCLVKFAKLMGILKNTYHFIASDGKHEAEITMNGLVRLKMQDVYKVEYHTGHIIVNTGSPHFVKFANDVKDIDVVETGREIRYSKLFKEEGINVNFTETVGEDSIFIRTYERGVEDETLSCGTGVTAAAIMNAHNDKGFNRVEVKTMGGNLSVEFEKIDDQQFENIWLCGPAELVYKGTIEL
jgi:diaminopimelate epimerase